MSSEAAAISLIGKIDSLESLVTLSRAINRQLKQLVEREGVLEEGSKDQTLEQLSEKRPERLPEKLVEQPQRTKVATKTAARNFPKNRPLPVRHRPVTRGWIEELRRSTLQLYHHKLELEEANDPVETNNKLSRKKHRVTKVIKHEDDEEHVFDKETDFDSALEIVYYKKGLTQPVTAVIKEDTTEMMPPKKKAMRRMVGLSPITTNIFAPNSQGSLQSRHFNGSKTLYH